MKKIIILAVIFAFFVLALVLADAFLHRPVPGISAQGEVTDLSDIDSQAILLE